MENDIFEKLKKSLCEFIKIPSVAGTPEPDAPCGRAVKEALDYIMNLSKDLGFTNFGNVDGYVGFAEVGQGDKCFGVLGHVDVVPVGVGWSVDPWCGEVIDGKVFGRGALDDKGPTLAALYAVHALLKEGYKPKMRIRFIYGCDEETGNGPISGWESIDRYMQVEKLPDIGISPDADFPVINAEKGILSLALSLPIKDKIISVKGGTALNIVPNLAEIELVDEGEDYFESQDIVVEKNEGKVEIIAHGKNAHAAHADKGDNAIIKLITYLSKVKGGEYVYISDKLQDVFASGINAEICDENSGRLTQNVGLIEYSNGELKLGVNIRYPVTFC